MQTAIESGELVDIDINDLKYSGRFYIPDKLYGREDEVASLCDEIRAIVTKKKRRNITFIVGVSGIGKSRVVLEVPFLGILDNTTGTTIPHSRKTLRFCKD